MKDLKNIQFNKYFFEARFIRSNDWEKTGYCFIAPDFYSKVIAPMVLKTTVEGKMELEKDGLSKDSSIVFFNKDFSRFDPFSQMDSSLTIEVNFNGQWIKFDELINPSFGRQFGDYSDNDRNQWSQWTTTTSPFITYGNGTSYSNSSNLTSNYVYETDNVGAQLKINREDLSDLITKISPSTDRSTVTSSSSGKEY